MSTNPGPVSASGSAPAAAVETLSTPSTITTESTAQIVADDLQKSLTGLSEVALLIAAGNLVGAGIRAAELAIDLVPPEALRDHLSAKGVQLANEAADALDKAKFGP